MRSVCQPVALAFVLMVLPIWSSCGDDGFSIPTPPDMGPILQQFSAPSAPLTEGTVPAILNSLDDVMGVVEGTDVSGFLLETVGGMFEQGSAEVGSGSGSQETGMEALEVGGTSLDAAGKVELVRICPGHGVGGVVDKANGKVTLTVVVTDQGLEPVVWGDAESCRYSHQGVDVVIDGEVQVYLGDAVSQWDSIAVDAPLINFTGSVVWGDSVLDGSLAVRLAEPGFQINLDTPDGNVLFYYASEILYGFVASNGKWDCDFEEGQCTDGSSVISLL